MATVPLIIARLEAVKGLHDNTPPQQLPHVLAAQHAALMESLKELRLRNTSRTSSTNKADLLSAVLAARFSATQQASLIDEITKHGVGQQRTAMQDYRSFVHYFTEQEWLELEDNSLTMDYKRVIIMKRLFLLGCRCPSEKSSKEAVAMLIILSGESKSASNSKFQVFKHFKNDFKSYVKTRTAQADESTCPLLDALPSVPELLKRTHEKLYASAYEGQGEPIPCRVDISSIIEMAASFACRAGWRVYQQQQQEQLPQNTQMMEMMQLMFKTCMQNQTRTGSDEIPIRFMNKSAKALPGMSGIEASEGAAQSSQRAAIADAGLDPTQEKPAAGASSVVSMLALLDKREEKKKQSKKRAADADRGTVLARSNCPSLRETTRAQTYTRTHTHTHFTTAAWHAIVHARTPSP